MGAFIHLFIMTDILALILHLLMMVTSIAEVHCSSFWHIISKLKCHPYKMLNQ